MDADIASRLLAVNQEFYQTFAAPFSATRQRLQPGVQRLLAHVPRDVRLLDVGCGNGELWRALARRGHRGQYVGVDFSPGLLAAAQAACPGGENIPATAENGAPPGEDTAFYAAFLAADLSQTGWAGRLAPASFNRATAFAVLHHLPGWKPRLEALQSIRRLLAGDGLCFLSNWQFLNSPRLRQRIQPWAAIGLEDSQVDPGDYLLDWRQGGHGLRYAHHFDPAELEELAQAAGFQVIETFLSDGAEGNLGLYQIWQ
jgi:tRNA (uracil-5-)-methyltransferase TRM9